MITRLFNFYKTASPYIVAFLFLVLIAILIVSRFTNARWSAMWLAFKGVERPEKIVIHEKPMIEEQQRLAATQQIAAEDLARRKKELDDREMVLTASELVLKRNQEALEAEKQALKEEIAAFDNQKTDWEKRIDDEIFRTNLKVFSKMEADAIVMRFVKFSDLEIAKYIRSMNPSLAAEIVTLLPDAFTRDIMSSQDYLLRKITDEDVKKIVEQRMENILLKLPKIAKTD